MPVFESTVKMWQQLIGGWADSCAQVDLSILPSSLPSWPPKLFTLPTISQPSSPSPLCPAHPLGLSFSLVPTFSGRGGNDVTDCPSAFTPHCWLSTIVPLVLSLYRTLPGPLWLPCESAWPLSPGSPSARFLWQCAVSYHLVTLSLN